MYHIRRSAVMTNILIINVMGAYSYGGRAVIKGAIRSLKENMPDAKISLMSSHYEKERDLYKKWNFKDVELVNHIWYKENGSLPKTLLISGLFAIYTTFKFIFYKNFKGIFPINSDFQQYDVIIDLTTDGPNEHYGMFMAFFPLFNTQLALMSGKPTVISAASIGTFTKPLTKSLAKFVLNRVNLITVREEITRDYLKSFGIFFPKIYITADHAFLMRPAPEKRIDEIFKVEGIREIKRPLIGVNLSILIHKYAFPDIIDQDEKYSKYISIIIETLDYLGRKFNGQILIIPHARGASSLAAASANAPKEDDRGISQRIYSKFKNDNIKLITGDYDADELKGIIGRCDLFIGCRMHATIASTSMCVPTIAMVYGHKSNGILGKMMGQENSLISVENYNSEELFPEIVSKIDYIYENRDNIRKDLCNRSKTLEKKALLNGFYVKELIESSRTKR